MARKPTPEGSRKKTLETLMESGRKSSLGNKLYSDYVEQYMSFYDNLNSINDILIEMKNQGNSSLNAFITATSEKRRISSEMRNILTFLGMKPPDGSGCGKKHEEL